MKNLVIVESQAKAKKIQGFLEKAFPSDSWKVHSCLGHVRDLKDDESAVDPKDWNNLKWESTSKGKKTLKEIREHTKDSSVIYLASDPDREGEAIAWHILDHLQDKKLVEGRQINRISFNEITPSAIKNAIENPRDIDQFLVEAYLARRVLDHLIGFKVSPLLWRHVPRAKSAGRVQSPTLRMICSREDEIDAFCPEEFWPIKVDFNAKDCNFSSDLIKKNGDDLKKVPIKTEDEAKKIKYEIENLDFSISEIKDKEVSYSPKAPFRTSTLQQAASSKLFFNPERTMQVAQSLYESGLITYMRTDGIGISSEIINEIRGLISSEFGEEYLPDSPKIYKSKAANAQEAHEPIRPTDIGNKPENTNGLNQDQLNLYSMIWQRTIASQLQNSRYLRKTILIEDKDKKFLLRTSGRELIFDGFEKVLKEGPDSEDSQKLKGVTDDSYLDMSDVIAEQKFTSPPRRFSEASLIKNMEDEGIGRPSTYANTVKNLRDRKYTFGAKSINPSDLGRILVSYLSKAYESFFIEIDFTAELEKSLDQVSSGSMLWTDVLDDFFAKLLEHISKIEEFRTREVLDMLNEQIGYRAFPKNIKGEVKDNCPKCSNEISIKHGRWGFFVGCGECQWTKPVFEKSIKFETYAQLPKDLGAHPDTGDTVYADISINGPCIWTLKEDKKIFGTPDEDEDILDIGLNRALELIDRSNAENILFIEPNSGIPVTLKNGRFGEYTEFNGFNKATKLKGRVTYDPDAFNYQDEGDRIKVLKSLRILGFEEESKTPIGIKIKKLGKAFKFKKVFKFGEDEFECPDNFYKLDDDEQRELVIEAIKPKKIFFIE
jgi:DNA topoisomerase-1